jgi:hypothetical protein
VKLKEFEFWSAFAFFDTPCIAGSESSVASVTADKTYYSFETLSGSSIKYHDSFSVSRHVLNDND